ncbi:GNAT family N-acetyltransferase [Gorillibacterium sp. CAU 1737]|uniref:GNAT family N-acetyltransferase n=1 Tax=Gorillibacterium sp. CAU 1737 TaxID=3140362 RepID=UPI003260E1A7
MIANDPITSERLLYRPFRMEDLEPYVAFCNEPSRRRWFYFQEPHCLEASFWKKGIENNIAAWSQKINLLTETAGCDLAIVLKETNQLIGSISLSKFHGPEEELDHVEIGYHLGEAYQGKGYATEAAIAFVEWGLAQLRELGTEPKIVGKAEHENGPSRRVLEKAGFHFTHAEQYVSVYEITG